MSQQHFGNDGSRHTYSSISNQRLSYHDRNQNEMNYNYHHDSYPNEFNNNPHHNTSHHPSPQNNDHQTQHRDHRYHQNTNNNSYNFVPRHRRLNEEALSFEDQLYLIFHQNQNNPLHFNQIKQSLSQRFGTNNVQYQDVYYSRFLYIISKDTFRIQLYIDDVCRKGFNCQLRSNCKRIHTITNNQTCKCMDTQCINVLHNDNRRITDRILECILFIFARYINHNGYVQLSEFRIQDNDFIETWNRFNPFSPPNFKRFISTYNRYYYDYQQQLNDPCAFYQRKQRGYIPLWNAKFRNDGNGWCIHIFHDSHFFQERTCSNAMNKSEKCGFVSAFLCPYFHMDRRICRIKDDCKCKHDWNGYCERYHVDRDRLKHSHPIPGSAWLRPQIQLENEIKDRLNPRDTFKLIKLNQIETKWTKKWTNKLNKIKNEINEIEIESIQRLRMHWNENYSDALELNCMSIIDGVFDFFDYKYTQNIIDIDFPMVSKTIILEYKVKNFQLILTEFARVFDSFPKQFCFNRMVSFSVKLDRDRSYTDGEHLVFEFANVNTFLSVQLMEEYFMDIITHTQLNKEFIHKNMELLESSSQYFESSTQYSNTATAYFVGLSLNCDNLINPNMYGMPVELYPLDCTVPNNIYNAHDTKFINYKEPRLYLYLKHNRIQNEPINNIVNIQSINCSDNVETKEYIDNTHNLNTQQYESKMDVMYDIVNQEGDNVQTKDINNLSKTDDNKCSMYEYSESSEEECVQIKVDDVKPEVIVSPSTYCNQDLDPEYSDSSEDDEVDIDNISLDVKDVWNDLGKILQAKHAAYHKTEKIFPSDLDNLNNLCRYCFMEVNTINHIQECLFVPTWIRNKKTFNNGDNNVVMWDGQHYRHNRSPEIINSDDIKCVEDESIEKEQQIKI